MLGHVHPRVSLSATLLSTLLPVCSQPVCAPYMNQTVRPFGVSQHFRVSQSQPAVGSKARLAHRTAGLAHLHTLQPHFLICKRAAVTSNARQGSDVWMGPKHLAQHLSQPLRTGVCGAQSQGTYLWTQFCPVSLAHVVPQTPPPPPSWCRCHL